MTSAPAADIRQEDSWFVAQCLSVDVATQAGSLDELTEHIKQALQLHHQAPESTTGPSSMDTSCARALPFPIVRLTLQAHGFTAIKQLGNHVKLIKTTGTEVRTAVLPHYQLLSASVVASICRQSGLPWSVFDSSP